MDWQQLSKHIKRNYEFIDRISIEDSDGFIEKIHPLLGISSAMTLYRQYIAELLTGLPLYSHLIYCVLNGSQLYAL